MKSLRIAMLGLKGIPATYGGVERHVEELATRLAAKGNNVTVFCRSFYTPKMTKYKEVNIVRIPTILTKHLEMIVHTFITAVFLLFKKYDIVHIHSVDPAILAPLLRIRHRVVVTSHGQAYMIQKWGKLARSVSQFAETIFIKYAEAAICVSKTLNKYYMKTYGREVAYIPNGVAVTKCLNDNLLIDFGLTKNSYILFVGRLIPTKGCDLLIEAYNRLNTDLKLVIVGGSCHTDSYESDLKIKGNSNTLFLGYQYGELLNQLYANCRLFIFPSEFEGLPVVLLEALSFGRPVIFSDIPQNLEVAKDYAVSFKTGDVDDLYSKLSEFIMNPEKSEQLSGQAKEHIEKNYNWDRIVEQTEIIYRSII